MWRSRLRAWVRGLLSLADEPGDDDDARLRKRMGVAAGYITIVAPLSIPFEVTSDASRVGLVLALVLSAFSAINLAVLARSHRFERYVVALISVGAAFVVFATAVSGGITSGSSGIVWAFLVPVYALLALGPRRATPWFGVFVAVVLVSILIDPIVQERVPPPPYPIQLIAFLPGLILPLTIVFLLLRYTDVRRREAEARSEQLLRNAIPPAIADRLKHGEDRIAEAYPDTTVVFADLVGFTPWSKRTDPARVVTLLDDLFTRLDALAERHGLEKVKTVGDAYMAVSGAPEARSEHAEAALAFGRGILEAVAGWRAANDLELRVRVGIASGAVVGGVIGRTRVLFDLWGDTVNTAARMESSGVPDRIQLAPSTRALLGDGLACEPREVEVKGLGTMTTYLLVDERSLGRRLNAQRS
jgi:adenylate cyclase